MYYIYFKLRRENQILRDAEQDIDYPSQHARQPETPAVDGRPGHLKPPESRKRRIFTINIQWTAST